MIFVLSCDIITKSSEYAAMAQSVEHVIGNDEVISSILISSSRGRPFGLPFVLHCCQIFYRVALIQKRAVLGKIQQRMLAVFKLAEFGKKAGR